MKIVFMGTPQAAVPSLQRIVADGHKVIEVWTQPDRPAGRGRRLTAPPVKECAEELGIEVFQPAKIKTRETRGRFKSLQADLAVVVAYGRILTKTYLESFPKGCINVHFSILPKYRGAAPVNWAIARGETETGVTTMKMDAGLDTGDILLVKKTDIGASEIAPELMNRLALLGADAISETLQRINEIEPVSQDDDAATHAPLFQKTDGAVDWSKSAKEISDQIRGFQPFPKTFSGHGDTQITFWKAAAVRTEIKGEPGEVLEAHGDELLIGCGGGTVLGVTELQVAGRARSGIRDFNNSGLIKAGDVFGD